MPVFKGSISSRLPEVGTTIFTTMSRLAVEENAINLSQGFPDFDCDPKLIEKVHAAMKKGHNQYAPMQGLISLRETISAKMESAYGCRYNPETEITITAGGTEALYSAIAAFVREGDEVLVFGPAYDSYEPAVQLNGGKAVFIELQAPSFRIPWEEVRKQIRPETRMIILNTPQNPTGTVLSQQDLLQLEALVKDSGIIVLSDEVYEHIIFNGEHQSLCRFPSLAERSILVFSFGKTFHVTGWKTGYVTGPAELMKEFRKAHQFIVFSCNTPLQVAINEYMQDKENYLALGQFYKEKRDYFCEGLKGTRFRFSPSEGTYFQLLDYSAITAEADTAYAVRMTKENKLASIPVSVFYKSGLDQKILRFCFAKKKETLDKALDISQKIG